MRDPQSLDVSETASLEFLENVGFGLDSVLMNDPKILVDTRFLASILLEFEEELGAPAASDVLFQVGLIHGLRDAQSALLSTAPEPIGRDDGAARVQAATPIAMMLEFESNLGSDAGINLSGHWPEHFEAEARLSRCGVSATPACALSAGYTSGWLSGTYDVDLLVIEERCVAAGAPECSFHARELAVWAAPGATNSSRVDRGLFARCRDAALGLPVPSTSANLPAQAKRPDASVSEANADTASTRVPSRFDPGDDAVHIWGPVMVLPLTHIEEALCTVEMLSRDPSTQGVGAVVVDLRQHPLDDEMIVIGLERIIDILCSWGAEVLLTGVSSIADPIVAELETTHLLTRKALPDAVAAAFQIAEAQRHAL